MSQKDIVGEFKSSGTADRAGPSDMGATATSEIDTEADRDAQAQFERVQAALKDGTDDKVFVSQIKFNFLYYYIYFDIIRSIAEQPCMVRRRKKTLPEGRLHLVLTV